VISAENIALTILAAAVALCLARLLRGPHLGDRVMAGDTVAVIVINIITVIGIRAKTGLYADVAAVIAILAFIGTVAAARFIRGRPPIA
jgi:multisubunit Na+/H+ antiporter MnhF subunit